jgi:hypothetical protein
MTLDTSISLNNTRSRLDHWCASLPLGIGLRFLLEAIGIVKGTIAEAVDFRCLRILCFSFCRSPGALLFALPISRVDRIWSYGRRAAGYRRWIHVSIRRLGRRQILTFYLFTASIFLLGLIGLLRGIRNTRDPVAS